MVNFIGHIIQDFVCSAVVSWSLGVLLSSILEWFGKRHVSKFRFFFALGCCTGSASCQTSELFEYVSLKQKAWEISNHTRHAVCAKAVWRQMKTMMTVPRLLAFYFFFIFIHFYSFLFIAYLYFRYGANIKRVASCEKQHCICALGNSLMFKRWN